MKKHIIKIVSMLMCLFFCFNAGAEEQVCERSLYKEIILLYTSGFYYRALSEADDFMGRYSICPYTDEILSLTGECCYRVKKYKEAEKRLRKALEHNKGATETELALQNKNYFYLGLVSYELGEYADCRKYLNTLCDLDDFSKYFYQSVIYIADTYLKESNYDAAEKYLIYVVNHGDNYTSKEYYENIDKLICVLNKKNDTKSIINLCINLLSVENILIDKIRQKLNFVLAESYNNEGCYKEAYNCYIMTTEGDDIELSCKALSLAYNLASSYPEKIKESPVEVFENIMERIDDENFLSEFWMRFAIDEYNNKNYNQSLKYFYTAVSYGIEKCCQISGIYISEIEANCRTSSEKEKALYAVERIKYFADKYRVNRNTWCYSDYMSFCVKWYGIEEDWNKVISSYRYSQENPSDVYYYALALYNKENYKEALEALSGKNAELYESKILKAQVLLKLNRIKESCAVYKSLDDNGLLSESDREDYALCLLHTGDFEKAYSVSKDILSCKGYYISGISLFNLKDWNNAKKYFARCINSDESKMTVNALFYAGYCSYKSENYRASYNELYDFKEKYPDSDYIWNVCIIMANCASILGMNKEAVNLAFDAINKSSCITDIEYATFLCSSIYAEQKKYDEAILVLMDSSVLDNDFGLRSKFQIAQLYDRKGDLVNSDRVYEEIYKKYPKTKTGEESLYRRGELFYLNGKYEIAVDRFEEYLARYPSGRFCNSAYYYEAESFFSMGLYEKAILNYLLLTNNKSQYDYNVRKKLVESYKKIGNYDEAKKVCLSLLSDYKEESLSDNITEEISVIEKLSQGIDEKLARLQYDYEKLNKSETVQGRKKGSELASYMYQKPSMQKDAYNLALKILEIQSSDENVESESKEAMENSFIIAKYYRKTGKNKEAGLYYLRASDYAVMCGNDESSQKALYGAVESFDAASLKTDARNTASLLLEKYPESIYAIQINKIFKNK